MAHIRDEITPLPPSKKPTRKVTAGFTGAGGFATLLWILDWLKVDYPEPDAVAAAFIAAVIGTGISYLVHD